MTFINRSVVISRAVTILRSNETYLRIACLTFAGVACLRNADMSPIDRCLLRMAGLILSQKQLDA